MKRLKSLPYSQKVAPYVFIAPFIIIFSVFFLYPIISTIIMSFQKVVPGQTQFVGLKNYKSMMNKTFYTALKNSATYTFFTCLILIPVPMFLAVLLNSKKMVAKGFFRSSLFLPALVCVVVAGIIFRLIFGERPGALMNSFLAHFGVSPIKWLAGPKGWTTMFTGLWGKDGHGVTGFDDVRTAKVNGFLTTAVEEGLVDALMDEIAKL